LASPSSPRQSIVLVPRIGATATVTALVVGQLVLAVAVDRLGVFGLPRADITAAKLMGLVLLIAGTILIARR
jgi:transporter family-2 protein